MRRSVIALLPSYGGTNANQLLICRMIGGLSPYPRALKELIAGQRHLRSKAGRFLPIFEIGSRAGSLVGIKRPGIGLDLSGRYQRRVFMCWPPDGFQGL